MAGERDLQNLLSSLKVKTSDDVFVFVTIKDEAALVPILAQIAPQMLFREAEGISLILARDEAEALQLPFEYPCHMITLDIHSSLEAVGFMARIARLLADAGISVNPVAGFYHDHLFVPVALRDKAIALLCQNA